MSQSIDGYKVSTNSTKTSTLRVKELSFGGGYRNIITDGLNADNETWNIEFVPYVTATATTLEGLLNNSKSSTANMLSWTPTGESSAKIWTASDIQKMFIGKDKIIIICTLRREFIL